MVIADLRHSERMRWLWRLLAWPLALYFAAGYWLSRYTSTVEILGEGRAFNGPAVYVHWHRHVIFLLGHNGGHGRWMMTSPAPYMEFAVRQAKLFGLRPALGASGAGGRAALAQLKQALDRGESVVIAVDGPAGPGFKVKRGCVELARAAGVPIVPMAYHSRRGREDSSRWDRILRTRVFDRIAIEYGAPIDASQGEAAALLQQIAQALNALDPGLESP